MHPWPVHLHLFSSQLCHLTQIALLPPRVYLAVFRDDNHAPPQPSFCQIKAAKPFFNLFSQAPPYPPTCFPPACVPVCAPLAQPPGPKHTGEGLMPLLVLGSFSDSPSGPEQRPNVCLAEGEWGEILPLLKPCPAPVLCRQTCVTNCAQCSAGPFSFC